MLICWTSTGNHEASLPLARNPVVWARDTVIPRPLLDAERPGRDTTPSRSGDTADEEVLETVDRKWMAWADITYTVGNGLNSMTLHVVEVMMVC